MRRLVLLLAGLVLALAPDVRAEDDDPPVPKPDGGLLPTLGFSHFDVEREEDRDAPTLDRIAGLGRALVKTVPIRWGRVEPAAPKGRDPTYQWTDVDRAVLIWQLAGLEPVLVLSPRSPWASMPVDKTAWAQAVTKTLAAGDAEIALRSGIGAAPPRMTAWRQWQRFVEDLVERYDGDRKDDMPGLRRPVRFVQVLDRADLPSRWLGSPEEYLRLLHHAGVGAKTAFERCQVVHACVDLGVTGFAPIPDPSAWKHRIRALIPATPPAARMEREWAYASIERTLEMPRLFDVVPHIGTKNRDDDAVNLRHLRAWLDRVHGSNVRVWLVDNPLPKLERSRVPRSLEASNAERQIRKTWAAAARYPSHSEYDRAKTWYARGLCYDLVRSYCAARVAGAEAVLFFPRPDQVPGAPLTGSGSAMPDDFLRGVKVGQRREVARGPLWHCWDQLVTHIGAHTDVTVAEIGAEGSALVFQLPVKRPRPWVTVLMLDSRLSWAGEPGKPMPTRAVALPLPNGRYLLETCDVGQGEPERREVAVDEGMLILNLGPVPVYVIPVDD